MLLCRKIALAICSQLAGELRQLQADAQWWKRQTEAYEKANREVGNKLGEAQTEANNVKAELRELAVAHDTSVREHHHALSTMEKMVHRNHVLRQAVKRGINITHHELQETNAAIKGTRGKKREELIVRSKNLGIDLDYLQESLNPKNLGPIAQQAPVNEEAESNG